MTGRSAAVTLAALALATAVACHDATAPKNPAGVTPEGVVVAARLSRTTFGLGDTVVATLVLRNPRDLTATLEVAPEPGVCGHWFSPATVGKDFGNLCGYISGMGVDTISIGAHDSLTYTFPLVAGYGMTPGTWTFRGEVPLLNEANGSDLPMGVQSNSVTAVLR